MENLHLQLLAKRLLSINLDDQKEEYILTDHEEFKILDYEIDQAKKHKAWKFAQMGASEEQILTKMASVNWVDEIDSAEILSRANSNKHYAIWEKGQREKEKQHEIQKLNELKNRCNYGYFYNLMQHTCENTFEKEFIVNEGNVHLIQSICHFFSGDERFETEFGYSLKKGLLVRGVSGLGKTFLFRCIEKNEIKPINIISMIDITETVKEEGFFEINSTNVLYLDDVGTEEHIVNHYGTKITWFKNFIELYYLKNKPFNRLIISTNNSFDQMEEKYGFRVRSRIKDMFNIIDVQGKDMRG